jgi:hypothetical protein
VESSSRSSPRTSPSVSTSGRPLSESGSVDTVDSDVVNIKTEVQDYSYESIQGKLIVYILCGLSDLYVKYLACISLHKIRTSSPYHGTGEIEQLLFNAK